MIRVRQKQKFVTRKVLIKLTRKKTKVGSWGLWRRFEVKV